MATTLTYGPTTVTLPDDLTWPDEFNWTPVAATSRYSAGGALLITRGVRLAGRPITLEGSATHAWITRTVAVALLGLVSDPDAAMTLSYRSVSYSVRFAPVENPLEINPVIDYADPDASDFYYATIRLIVT